MVYSRFRKHSAVTMAYRRSTLSPGRQCLMNEVLRVVAGPGSPYPKKIPEIPCFPKNGKVKNHDYCVVCTGGGEIVCCDKCPKSFHIKCHSPSINKLPEGEWLCKDCALIENGEIDSEVPTDDDVDIQTLLKNQIRLRVSRYPSEEFLSEVSIRRKYNIKPPYRKQLDKMKLLRKNDKCFVCKRGVLKGRLVQCSYCWKLYHLNCLDPPIRDWDHSMQFQCPLHDKFYEMVYPTIFTPDCGLRSDTVTIKRKRCDFISKPVNKCFNIPSHIEAMYKEPEENIPMTEKSSLINILCDIASFELQTINSNYSINSNNNISNDITTKFLTHRNNKLEKIKCSLPKQPTASLSCISIPINISIQKNSFTIGKHLGCDLCLLPYGNCEFISDQHVTITFDSKLGDFLVKNHSRHGIIVDNVSYFGNHRPKEVSNKELKVINSQVKKYINKRRRTVYTRNFLRIYKNSESENVIIKYANRKRKFDYGLMFKYYSNKFRNIKHTYRKILCKCSKSMIPKDGYFGQAILRNKSIMSIGCMKFLFSYNAEEVPKICAVSGPKVCAKKVTNVCASEVSKICKESVSNEYVEEFSNTYTQKIPEINTKHVSKFNVEEQSNTSAEVPEVYVNKEIPEVVVEEVSNVISERKIVEVLTEDNASKILDQTQNGAHRSCLSEITASFTSLINRYDSLEEQNLFKQVYLDNPSDCEFSDSHLEINSVPNDMELDKNNHNIQASNNDSNLIFNDCNNPILDDGDGPSLNDDIDPALNISGDPTLNICGDPTLNDVQITGPVGLESHEQCIMDLGNGVQSCYVNDLVLEVEESFSDGCEIVEEEVLFELGYDPAERVDNNIQNWIEEIDVEEENGFSANQQSQLQANSLCNIHGDYKTEHMYCARSPTYEMPTIVISSDDDE